MQQVILYVTWLVTAIILSMVIASATIMLPDKDRITTALILGAAIVGMAFWLRVLWGWMEAVGRLVRGV